MNTELKIEKSGIEIVIGKTGSGKSNIVDCIKDSKLSSFEVEKIIEYHYD